MRGPLVAFTLATLGACAAHPDAASETLHAARATLEILVTPATEAPLDGPPLVTLRLRREERERALPGAWIGAVPWDGAAATLAPDHTLSRADLEGDQTIAQHVTALPIVSPDGAHLAFAVSEDLTVGELHVVDALGERVIARELSSIGALAFSPDGARVAFVGAARSGIAGVWIADARGIDPARCLTNCQLEPGSDLNGAVPLPETPLEVTHTAIRWLDARGVAHEVTR